MKTTISILLLFLSSFSVAQTSRPVELEVLRKSKTLPENLGSGRSAVIISTPNKADWKKYSTKTHNQLKQMQLDVVMYVHYLDFNASPLIREKFIGLLDKRGIKNLFIIRVENNKAEVLIGNYTGDDALISPVAENYFGEEKTLNDVLFELALMVRRMNYPKTNFLIPDAPEHFEDLPLITGTEFPVYPTQLKRLPLAVTLFDYLEIDSTLDLTQQQKNIIRDYNDKIRQKNDTLKKIFESYPYRYEFINTMTDKEAFQKGFQFILSPLHTSGKTIKSLLNIDSESIETDFISIVPIGEEQRMLKTIPVNETVYKYYLKQTASGDAYLGRYWDASRNWRQALTSFLAHMQREFNK